MATAMCNSCGAIGMSSGGDGFYYCLSCGTQSQDLREELADGDEMMFQGIYSNTYKRSMATPIQSQAELDSQAEAKILAKIQQANMTADEVSGKPLDWGDSDDEHQLWDFGPSAATTSSAEALSSKIRALYLGGMQRMIQLQCEALVEKFGVTPLICGTAAPIWLRFMASTRVCQPAWADEALQAADAAYEEANKTGREAREGLDGKDRPDSRYRRSAKFKAQPRSLYGKKAQFVWASSLKNRIPVAASLAISFLACHMSREAILPTDMIKWALEGKIPYLAAFIDIEKSLEDISRPWPFSLRFLLRPQQVLGARRLELLSAWVAKRIGLRLPPVNFHSISHRFLSQLQLPVEKIFPHVERMYEWSPPPGLWLSVETKALPTRVYVMGMLVIVIKILYNLNGQGYWEKSLAIDHTSNSVQCDESSSKRPTQEHFEGRSCRFTGDCVNGISLEDNRDSGTCSIQTAATGISTSSIDNLMPFQGCELDATAMLQNLETWDQDNDDRLDYARDLPTYLKYCKDVIFAGSKTSYDEENLIQHFWQLYERIGNGDLSTVRGPECSARADVKQVDGIKERVEHLSPTHSSGGENQKDKRLEGIISDMIQNGFQYICPTRDCPADSYLRYRKKKVGKIFKVYVHADYYILLRACARVIKVDAYALHRGIWKIEKRVGWIEDRVQNVIWAKSGPEDGED